MNSSLNKWLKVSLFNLSLVAFFGVILRYKIEYSLPFIDQKFLLHGHSHFAFAGWVTQALMALLVGYLYDQHDKKAFNRYRWILYANLITAYGMLVTFPVEGYAFLSILFSTLSLFVSYVFAFVFWKDLNRIPTANISHSWFKASLIFNVISSIGPFYLAYMMATKHIHQNAYLASIYFFLHFQYNGWFFFACMGLLSFQLSKYGIAQQSLKKVYWFFALACIPAYFLSALWLPIPSWLYYLVVLSAFMQLAGWLQLLKLIKKHLHQIEKQIPLLSKRLLLLCSIALSVKLILQAASVIPSLSDLAFGFRPIVIGYLHLVLLGVISLFIIINMITHQFISVNKTTITGFIIFIFGIILNEFLLMIQGIGDLGYTAIPYINFLLFIAAIVLFTGAVVANYGQISSKYDLHHKASEFVV